MPPLPTPTKNAYVETTTTVLGFRKKTNKKWITPDMWGKIGETKDLEAKMSNTKSPGLNSSPLAYEAKDRELKRSAKSDKRTFVDNLTLGKLSLQLLEGS